MHYQLTLRNARELGHLTTHHMFDELTSDELSVIEKIAKLRKFNAGDPIINEGSCGTSFFLLISGKVEVRKAMPNSRYRTLVEIGPCGVFGELCFLGVESRSASVIAITNSDALEFDKDAFEELMKNTPGTGMKVYRSMAQELAHRLANLDEELKDTIIWAMGQRKGSLRLAAEPPKSEKWAIRLTRNLSGPTSSNGVV